MASRKTIKNDELTYSKKQLVSSNLFSDNRDLLQALLDDDDEYSINDTKILIKDYLNKEV